MASAAPFSRLYPILDDRYERLESLPASVEALARAGCRMVQIRGKRLTARELLEWTKAALAVARPLNVKLIVNDRADVALLAGADGAHVGQDDLAPEAVRRLLGPDAIVGLSTHSVSQARAARDEPVDYVAIGPAFSTSTKHAAGTPLGIDGVLEVRAAVAQPLVAIGGITLDTAPALFAGGVDGVAVISALKDAAGKSENGLEEAARTWLQLENETRTKEAK